VLNLKQKEFITKRNEMQLQLQNARMGMVDPMSLTLRIEENQSSLIEIAHNILSLDAQMQSYTQDRDRIMTEFRTELENHQTNVDHSKAKISSLQRQLDRTEYSLESTRAKLDALHGKGENPSQCPTCKQPLNDSHSHVHWKQEYDEAATLYEKEKNRKNLETKQLQEETTMLHELLLTVSQLQTKMQQTEKAWLQTLSTLSQQLSSNRLKQATLNEENNKILRLLNHEMEMRAQEISFQADLRRYSDMIDSAKITYEALQTELDEMDRTLSRYESDREMSKSNASMMTSLSDALGKFRPCSYSVFIKVF
jgi:DNA repair exonuclease SbcCD ATPase subunit